tara:strand:+ start:246 stop:1535 length:1290 start_codon:yes stop_codon:yes gene_type:complete
MKHEVIPADADLNALLKEKEEELKKFDMEFRPHSYWGSQELETNLLSKIKGQERRRIVKKMIEDGDIKDNAMVKEKLTEWERKTIGRLHPVYMGGEYLPDANKNQVEIARVIMKSTTQDIISIRATKRKNNINYSIDDEYADDELDGYVVFQKTSKYPFSFKELINFLDNSQHSNGEVGICGGARDANYTTYALTFEEDPEDHWDFETADSPFYSQLEEWYDIQNWIWLIKRKLEIVQYANFHPQFLKTKHSEIYVDGRNSEFNRIKKSFLGEKERVSNLEDLCKVNDKGKKSVYLSDINIKSGELIHAYILHTGNPNTKKIFVPKNKHIVLTLLRAWYKHRGSFNEITEALSITLQPIDKYTKGNYFSILQWIIGDKQKWIKNILIKSKQIMDQQILQTLTLTAKVTNKLNDLNSKQRLKLIYKAFLE